MTKAYHPQSPAPGSSFLPSLAPGALNHELPELADARNVIERFSVQCAENRERLYWRMIAEGQLPSQGWRMCERIDADLESGRLTHSCWPVPPEKF